jgi:CBS domain-containing protein
MASLDEVETRVLVKDIMSSPATTALEEDNVEKVAKLMSAKSIGSVVITDRKGSPVGIITERDIVRRVTAKNLVPRNVKAKEVMSTPLAVVTPYTEVNEAARKMSKLDIRRLGVMDKGRLVGIISSKDIVALMPELMEIMTEKARITATPSPTRGSLLVGYCNNCEQWSDTLRDVDGKFLCEECRIELEQGEGKE